MKAILEDEGRRQSWLARRVGIDQGDLSRIVNRGLIPNADVMEGIADALGRSVEELWPEREEAAA